MKTDSLYGRIKVLASLNSVREISVQTLKNLTLRFSEESDQNLSKVLQYCQNHGIAVYDEEEREEDRKSKEKNTQQEKTISEIQKQPSQDLDAGEFYIDELLETYRNQDSSIFEKEYGTQVLEMLHFMDNLTVRERHLISYRFGIEDRKEHSLEECAEKFGITRERVRQIESKVFRRVHKRTRSKSLKEYLD